MRNKVKAPWAGIAMLWITLFAFGSTLWAQPVVQVPAGCNVVVAGTGTGVSTGFGGVVGNGGIVIMPDPFDLTTSAGDFTVIPYTATITGWSLLGDLSVQTSSSPPTAPTQSATGLTVNIQSYNKNLRLPSETAGLSLSTMARSKGRVYIGYNDNTTSCGGRIEFDVLKDYMDMSFVPPIIGPDCWLPDSTYTYSVDQIASDNLTDAIGLDTYYWYIQDSGGTVISPSLFYTSADKSSITLDAPSLLLEPYTITACYGRANPWDGNTLSFPTPLPTHQKCVSKVVGGSPTQPTVTIPACVGINDPNFEITISPYVLTYNYVWESTNPLWVFTSNVMGDTVTVSGIGDGPGTVTLSVENGSCSSIESEYMVNREFTAPYVSILATDTCLSAGSSYNFKISPSGAQLNNTCWNLPTSPSPWGLSPNNGTNSDIDVLVPVGTAPGSYTLEAFACSCSTSVVTINVNVRPENPSIVSGDTCIVFGSTSPLTYVVSPPGSYVWTIPSGWSGTSTNESITVTPNGTGTGTITVQGTTLSGCNSLGSASWDLYFEPVTPTGATVGCLNFGYNSTTSATITNAPSPFFGTFVVTSTPGGLLNTPAANVNPLTGAITLNILDTAPTGSYTLHFAHVTHCDTSAVFDVGVTMSALSVILDTTYTIAYDLYQVSPPIGSAYIWFFDGVPITPPNNSPVLFLNNTTNPVPLEVCVNVLNGATGCYTRVCAPGGNFSRSMALPGGTLDMEGIPEMQGVRVFPNPNDGNFTVEVPAFNTSASVRMVDVTGREVGNFKLQKGQNRIADRDFAAGTYHLIFSMDGRAAVHTIQIAPR